MFKQLFILMLIGFVAAMPVSSVGQTCDLVVHSVIDVFPSNEEVKHVAVGGDNAVVATDDTIKVVSVQDPQTPAIRGELSNLDEFGIAITNIAMNEDVLVYANRSNFVWLVDLSDPNSPRKAGNIAPSFDIITAVAVQGSYAYAVSNSAPSGLTTLHVINIADPDAPVAEGAAFLGAFDAKSLAVVDDRAYAGGKLRNGNTNFISILAFDIADPFMPMFLYQSQVNTTATVNSTFNTIDIAADMLGSYPITTRDLYALNPNGGLLVDTSFPAANPLSAVERGQSHVVVSQSGVGLLAFEDGIGGPALDSPCNGVAPELAGVDVAFANESFYVCGGAVDDLAILSFGQLHFVDVTAELLQPAAAQGGLAYLSTDFNTYTPRTIASDGRRSVSGTSTDGEARVALVCYSPLNATEIEFELSAGGDQIVNENLGQLQTVDGQPAGSSSGVQTLVVQTQPSETVGAVIAVAILQAPRCFTRPSVPGDDDAPERQLVVNTRALFSGGEDLLLASRTMRVVRPPVAFVHGLWSDRNAWWELQPFREKGYFVQSLNYERTNASSVMVNDAIIFDQLVGEDGLLQSFRDQQDVAAVRCDVVAHSMGGLLMKRIIGDQSTRAHRSADNFFAGFIQRVLTINTPHLGASLATFLVESDGQKVDNLLTDLWPVDDLPITQGAVQDLRPDSDTITGIPSMVGRGAVFHAIVGTGGTMVLNLCDLLFCSGLSSSYGTERILARALNRSDILVGDTDLFDGDEHDLVVTVASQQGGLSLPNVITTFNYLDAVVPGIHTTVNSAEMRVRDSVISLLGRCADASDFTDVLPASSPTTPPPTELVSAVRSDIVAGPINQPTIGGEVVDVTVMVPSDLSPKTLVLGFEGGGVGGSLDISDPNLHEFVVPVEIPVPVAGQNSWALRIVVATTDGEVYVSEDVVVSVESVTLAPITAITATFEHLTLTRLARAKDPLIEVHRADGNISTVSVAGDVVSAAIVDPTIAEILQDGRISALRVGTTELLVSANGIDFVLPVVVKNRPTSSCEADMNGDWILDQHDALIYLVAAADETFVADINEDGVVDMIDTRDMMLAFTRGCFSP